jgi:hypothetical protein
METHIFLLCYNESVLIPHTVSHYKKYLPSCKITIYDNESTDNSVEVAKSLNCDVITFSSQNIQNEYIQQELKNNCWKNIESGWVIVADMDEFLCVKESELIEEKKQGTTMLNVLGVDMVGESDTIDLTDIDFQQIKKISTENSHNNSKKLCFLRESIVEMNYLKGAHVCYPVGDITLSSNIYINKHMNYLGLNYYINKMIKRYERNEIMRQHHLNGHYSNDIEEITQRYKNALNSCIKTNF